MPTITGISIKRFPKSNMEFAELSVLRAVEEVDNEKFQQTGIGFSTDIPYNKQALKIDVNYARQLIQTRAFVPNREYELNLGSNPNDPLDILVNQLIPVDDDIKKHFDTSMKNSQVVGAMSICVTVIDGVLQQSSGDVCEYVLVSKDQLSQLVNGQFDWSLIEFDKSLYEFVVQQSLVTFIGGHVLGRVIKHFR